MYEGSRATQAGRHCYESSPNSSQASEWESEVVEPANSHSSSSSWSSLPTPLSSPGSSASEIVIEATPVPERDRDRVRNRGTISLCIDSNGDGGGSGCVESFERMPNLMRAWHHARREVSDQTGHDEVPWQAGRWMREVCIQPIKGRHSPRRQRARPGLPASARRGSPRPRLRPQTYASVPPRAPRSCSDTPGR